MSQRKKRITGIITIFIVIVIIIITIGYNYSLTEIGAILDIPQMKFDLAEQHMWSGIFSVMFSGEKNEETGVKDKNLREAVSWYKNIAGSEWSQDKRYPPAQCALGYCYEGGYGVWKDPREAERWFNMSRDGLFIGASQGEIRAQYALGAYYLGFGSGERFRGEEEMRKWLNRAAEEDYAPAQFVLGFSYQTQLFAKEDDLKKAARWYQKAADQGFAPAQIMLALCYMSGDGVEKDEEKAVEMYRKAAKKKYAPAQFLLGLCYLQGTGVVKDEEKAIGLFLKAAEQEFAPAQYQLGECFAHGSGVMRDEEKAIEWYLKAADQGNGNAQKELRRRGLWADE